MYTYWTNIRSILSDNTFRVYWIYTVSMVECICGIKLPVYVHRPINACIINTLIEHQRNVYYCSIRDIMEA